LIKNQLKVNKFVKTFAKWKDDDKENKVKKILFGGDYYNYDASALEWERTGQETKDFFTLIRQTVNIILGFQGIIAREFVSYDGYFIVTVCYGHEFNLKMVVEYLRMKKFMEVSFIDLMSLEPIDNKRRPLRLHETIQDIKTWELKYGGANLELFHKIRKARKKINFQKMVREFKGVWDKDMIREENAKRQIYEHADVLIETWENYLIYLTNLLERITQIRLDFKTKQLKTYVKFHSKFQGYTDFGFLLKRMTMKTHKEDYFHFKYIKKYLVEKKSKQKFNSKKIQKQRILV
jgi:hypothetical protein